MNATKLRGADPRYKQKMNPARYKQKCTPPVRYKVKWQNVFLEKFFKTWYRLKTWFCILYYLIGRLKHSLLRNFSIRRKEGAT
jgi:hypothetical protein